MNKPFILVTFILTLSITACGGKRIDNSGTENNAVFNTVPPAPENLERKLAIVYSKTNEAKFWSPRNYSQLFMSVQTQAMMAGLPYDVLNEDDLLDINKIRAYKTLVFPLFSHVPIDKIEQISANLKAAIDTYNVGLITTGDFLTNTETGASITGNAYRHMINLFGIQRKNGATLVDFEVNMTNINHPALINQYTDNETVLSYKKGFTNYFTPTGAYPSEILATQQVNNQTENSIIAITNKGRHAHFSSVQTIGDSNLLWSILQWSVWGKQSPATLHLGRSNALFASRNDMDQSMFHNEVATVEEPLLAQVKDWKARYDFVGSYYINVGDDAANEEFTDWRFSAPLYQQFISLGNEIGNHSYTHPAFTDKLTDAEINFEFPEAREIIEKQMGLTNIGAAIPGNPETLATSLKILPHSDYLSGGYAARGAGFPNAFGFLNADVKKIYLSPNMSFDFTLIEFQKRSAAEAKQIWAKEFDDLTQHAFQPILHWPWHDYAVSDLEKKGYTVDLLESVISKANDYGSEFVTGKDLSERMKSFSQSAVNISTENNTLTATVKSSNAGQFSLRLNNSLKISSVNQWYAYNETTVFLGKEGGSYTLNLGNPKAITRIHKLPNRSKLISLSGNNEDLKFQLTGEGTVEIITKCDNPSSIKVTGGTRFYKTIASNKIALKFDKNRAHEETSVNISCP
ncbi:MAG: hypothetical protein KAG28_00880 [Cocleimonas sp.]|nr:hypothetical protein [Cocleimonas sp.]